MQAAPFGAYGLSISVLLVSIMLAIGGVLLGGGYALNDKRLKELGRNEILQSLINGALVGGFLLLFSNGGIIGSFVNSAALANGTRLSCSPFLQYNAAICFAYDYLIGPNQYYYLGSYHSSVLSSVTLIITGLISLYAVLGIFKVFLSPVLAQIQGAVQALGAVAVSATVQASVLMFVAASALTLILPLGLILRTFYPSRKMGSFLIALTIGMYVVLPMTYLLNAAIANAYSLSSNQTSLSTLSLETGSIESGVMSYASQGANSTGIVYSLISIGSGISAQISNLMSYIFRAIAYFIVYAFVLPAFSLMITAISVKELAAMLGSDNFFGRFNLL
jgi:hypothetical protein